MASSDRPVSHWRPPAVLVGRTDCPAPRPVTALSLAATGLRPLLVVPFVRTSAAAQARTPVGLPLALTVPAQQAKPQWVRQPALLAV